MTSVVNFLCPLEKGKFIIQHKKSENTWLKITSNLGDLDKRVRRYYSSLRKKGDREGRMGRKGNAVKTGNYD